MILNYARFQQRLQDIAPIGRMDPGLERIRAALKYFDHPDRDYRAILVAGTKGKGSTSLFAAAYLAGLGHRVGLFTSPHLVDIGERILVDGGRVPVEFLSEGLDRLEALWERGAIPKLSFFETMNLLAALYFRKHKVEYAVWEVGLGGRLDSTNALKRQANVLTKVSKDHMEWLGQTLSSILSEKLAIYRKGHPIIVSRQMPRIREEILACVSPNDISLFGRDFSWRSEPHSNSFDAGARFQYVGQKTHQVVLKMKGDFQRDNASNALRVAEAVFGELLGSGIRALETAYWPGRFEEIQEDPPVILDGAHNPDSFRALCRNLQCYYPAHEHRFMIGIQSSKDYAGMLKVAERVATSYVFVSVPNAIHPLDPNVLASCVRKPSRVMALDAALEQIRQSRSRRHTVYCITGSLFLVGAVRERLGIQWKKPYA
ncbi:MAG: bifunctional folylpolyglutamate synthase/dihydrofolate synthase [bacterium]